MGGNDAVRRTWDTEAYARRAALSSRGGIQKRGRGGGPRSLLKARETKHDLDARVGTVTVVEGGRDRRGGYWCESCESLLKDSNAWLNHVNGRRHQRVLGMGMRVERSGTEDVRERLRLLRKKEGGKRGKVGVGRRRGGGGGNEKSGMETGREKVKEIDNEEVDEDTNGDRDTQEAAGKDNEGANVVERNDSSGEERDDDKAADAREVMGLPVGFGSSKAR